MTEVYLLFFQSILPSFTHANMFIQKEEPLIHVLQAQLTKLVKTILGKFVKPSVIAYSIRNKCLSSISFANSAQSGKAGNRIYNKTNTQQAFTLGRYY